MRSLLLSLAWIGLLGAPLAQAQSGWPYWDHYAARFLNSQGRVIDPDRNSMTTSEAQSYAMFFSLVANDRDSFERIVRWTGQNLADNDLAKNLPAWSWGHKDDGSWGVLDPNSAADADLWIAYSLIEAGELWHQPDYDKTGRALLSLIVREEVSTIPNVGTVLLPGRTGFHTEAGRWILNPSYLPLPLLTAADHFAPGGPWRQMAQALPGWLQQTSPAGYAMDWVECGVKSCFPAGGPAGGTARGSYDAIRVYLWAGMTDRQTPEAARLEKVFAPAFQYVKTHPAPPEIVAADGNVVSASVPVSFSAVFIPFFRSSGDRVTVSRLEQNVLAQFDPSSGLLGTPPRYYDQNLALFVFGWQEQKFRFAPDGTLRVPWKK
ncbi:cellulose synthase complex periplasmic endoglucanase BcsZ [Paracidobacterium acidisoli]|uniref:cellulase n=1 Tax=Paracidobacterium acidisoli TaxID=2303751 RepID=A0A372IV18_9BACT|nr:cellulose synthase complex periplasmic endoglucanase BcsZ [Paracidobacterium acidisoli]MBT9330117.1 cellulase [Paracidobacterium acidisoli]